MLIRFSPSYLFLFSVISCVASKLRYPLRSASKPRDGKVAGVVASGSSLRKGTSPSVSKSISVLELSEKGKTPKPPRRLSIPSKSSSSSSRPATIGSVTPISKYHVNKQDHQGNSDTPASDASKSVSRKKFSVLSSVSYWLSQIKLSESAAKHSVSLPLQRVREELKSYANRHKILELGEPAREVLKSYSILEEVEEFSQAAQSCSQQPARSDEEETKCSDEVSSCSSRSGNPQPKPDSSRNGSTAAKSRPPYNRTRPVTDASNRKAPKPQKQQKNASSDSEKPELKTSTLKKPAPEIETNPFLFHILIQPALHPDGNPLEDKENVDHELVEQANPGPEVETT
ncbi:unnamed protein product [Spirodela intermedia]|uniref:Uncharacterized protein n=1 Tax=Spirodela intermedia TaxID=51605 RepID=A0A7I8ITE4_SPIIN|nr:unnamed protein product [Spirodela intermedia]CAA6660874.1 unnamed protein product [Spirodela intermedia]